MRPVRTGHILRWGAMVGCATLICCVKARVGVAANPIEHYQAVSSDYGLRLKSLADALAARGDMEAARRVAEWRSPVPADQRRYYFPPGLAFASEKSTKAADGTKAVERFRQLRTDYAAALFELAKNAAGEKRISDAVAWTYETLREDPTHAGAARVLGLQLVDGRYLSAFEAAKHRAGDVWHERFGWLPQTHLARYEAGERYLQGKWVTSAEDARIHAAIERGWVVDTENFRVRTNHSLEEGARLAARLEKMHLVWRQLFARYHTAEGEWTRRFAGGAMKTLSNRRYNVVYYRNRNEYVAALERREAKIGLTSGIFMSDDDTAYFFADAERSNDPFVFHEVTHQLFSLSKATTLKVGERNNFWFVEGVACYFESLVLHPEYGELGRLDNIRLKAARFRLLQDGFYIPLAEFTAFSRAQLQSDPRIATLYSQAAGLAAFLLDGDEARYREAAVDYLHAIYGNRATPVTLAELTGRSYPELDADYRTWMTSLP